MSASLADDRDGSGWDPAESFAAGSSAWPGTQSLGAVALLGHPRNAHFVGSSDAELVRALLLSPWGPDWFAPDLAAGPSERCPGVVGGTYETFEQRVLAETGRSLLDLVEQWGALLTMIRDRSVGQISGEAVWALFPEVDSLATLWAQSYPGDTGRDARGWAWHADEDFAWERTLADFGEGAANTAAPAALAGQLAELAAWSAAGRCQGVYEAWDDEAVPAHGWASWFAEALFRSRQLIRTTAGARRVVPAPSHRTTLRAITADRRYRCVQPLLAAYEGPIDADVDGGEPGEGFHRFRRATGGSGLGWHLTHAHLCDLITAARIEPRLLSLLGIKHLLPADDPLRVLSFLDSCMHPAFGVPRPAEDPTDVTTIPLNGWELRFRFPELTEFLSIHYRAPESLHRDSDYDEPSAAWLQAEAVAATREPGYRLAPIIGEITELLVLLPDDQDLERAITHLGGPAGRREPWPWREWLRYFAGLLHRYLAPLPGHTTQPSAPGIRP